ncbi:MAG: hypothetical protein UZ16_OP3001002480 [Candidatus Hinthialibacteria bacterium OLB16]|nr:MAG: hypothetical protein UZ16_OP3001002480 [Candidatus Hinthialibacteria bacterium OLB16]
MKDSLPAVPDCKGEFAIEAQFPIEMAFLDQVRQAFEAVVRGEVVPSQGQGFMDFPGIDNPPASNHLKAADFIGADQGFIVRESCRFPGSEKTSFFPPDTDRGCCEGIRRSCL